MLEDLANIGEAIGGIAVIASLLFLAYQLSQNTKTLRAQSAFDAENSYAHLNLTIASDQALAELAMRCLNADSKPEDFTPGEWGQLFWLARASFQQTEARWFLKEQGMLPEPMWEKTRLWMKGFIDVPVVNFIWLEDCRQHGYVQGFIDEINSTETSDDVSMVAPSQSGDA